ncbi:peptidase S8/S53 domain-containing protein [Bombardia bombarda]|uniref:Peptidase S8/S53 domain-containing protein n=1 Tax=Bombardia bombarda TaxID=252184 RepID=A0AA40BY65_9PEZI|nr:peptidase S8/S53 domain-containing protein [Bombardia bombarda]
MSRLYQSGKERSIEFDLVGMPNPVSTRAYLDKLAHLKFESILKYVALPALSIERQPLAKSANSHMSQHNEQTLSRAGCSDLVAVFDWLWRNGVREIIKVMVVDNQNHPHADAAIVEALYGFNVEVCDWKRVDLCSDVIFDASPVVREVSMYCSGSNAVLMGWASAEGLGNRRKFPQLKKVKIYMMDGLEDEAVRNRNTERCKAGIERQSKMKHNGEGLMVEDPNPNAEGIRVEIVPDKAHKGILSEINDSPGSSNVQPVKIAIIDDGIDPTADGLEGKIAGGAMFCPNPKYLELVQSYFLYIARLEEVPVSTGSGRNVTARSAAKAVNWAINSGVDIISMSWTIRTTAPETTDMKSLHDAIKSAESADIIMFCSASDQGGHTPEKCYPGEWDDCLRIGAATFDGDKLIWVGDKVDFCFPGRDVPFQSNDGHTVTTESGSSVATAAASGLAAVLIYADRLVDGKSRRLQSRHAMKTALEKMSTGSDKRFPRAAEILGTQFKNEWWAAKGTERGSRGLNIENLTWDRSSQKALEELLKRSILGY